MGTHNITDEMVDAAARAIFKSIHGKRDFDTDAQRRLLEKDARAALEAALPLMPKRDNT